MRESSSFPSTVFLHQRKIWRFHQDFVIFIKNMNFNSRNDSLISSKTICILYFLSYLDHGASVYKKHVQHFDKFFFRYSLIQTFFLQKQITYLSRQNIHLLKFVNLKCVTLLKQITTEFISADRNESKHSKTILVLFLKNHKAHNCSKSLLIINLL